MGNLVSGAADDDRFSCITEKSHLSVSLYTDEASSGPALSSFLGRGPNGTIKLVNKDEKCTKSDELSSIIGISRLDVLKDGNEEVVICNANGLTHIVSTKINQDIIRYHHKKGSRTLLTKLIQTVLLLRDRDTIFYVWRVWWQAMLCLFNLLEPSPSVSICSAPMVKLQGDIGAGWTEPYCRRVLQPGAVSHKRTKARTYEETFVLITTYLPHFFYPAPFFCVILILQLNMDNMKWC